MANYTVTSISELRSVLGYYNDAGTARVAGTAVAGDKVSITMTGTQDLSATNNIIYPAAGVEIYGPGKSSLTIQGRLYWAGNGGTSVVGRMSDLTWDSKGYAALPTALVSGAIASTKNAIYDTTTVIDNTDFIDSVGGVTANQVTCISVAASSGVVVYAYRCSVSSSGADTWSLKGSATLSNDSTCILQECELGTPGTGSSDQAFAPHDGFHGIMYGGSAARGSVSGECASNPDGGLMQFVNTSLVGEVIGVDYMAGVDLDGDGQNGVLRPSNKTGMVFKSSRVYNWQADTNARLGVLLTNDSDGGTYLFDKVDFDNAQGTAVGTTGTLGTGATGEFRDCVIQGGMDRGVDMRLGNTTTLTRLVNGADTLSYLDAANPNQVITLDSCISATASVSGGTSATSGGSVVRAITASDIEGAGAGKNTQQVPSNTRLVSLIMAGESASLLGGPAETIANNYAAYSGPVSDGRFGIIGRPLRGRI